MFETHRLSSVLLSAKLQSELPSSATVSAAWVTQFLVLGYWNAVQVLVKSHQECKIRMDKLSIAAEGTSTGSKEPWQCNSDAICACSTTTSHKQSPQKSTIHRSDRESNIVWNTAEARISSSQSSETCIEGNQGWLQVPGGSSMTTMYASCVACLCTKASSTHHPRIKSHWQTSLWVENLCKLWKEQIALCDWSFQIAQQKGN